MKVDLKINMQIFIPEESGERAVRAAKVFKEIAEHSPHWHLNPPIRIEEREGVLSCYYNIAPNKETKSYWYMIWQLFGEVDIDFYVFESTGKGYFEHVD